MVTGLDTAGFMCSIHTKAMQYTGGKQYWKVGKLALVLYNEVRPDFRAANNHSTLLVQRMHSGSGIMWTKSSSLPFDISLFCGSLFGVSELLR